MLAIKAQTASYTAPVSSCSQQKYILFAIPMYWFGLSHISVIFFFNFLIFLYRHNVKDGSN